jgi:hypothetical protein
VFLCPILVSWLSGHEIEAHCSLLMLIVHAAIVLPIVFVKHGASAHIAQLSQRAFWIQIHHRLHFRFPNFRRNRMLRSDATSRQTRTMPMTHRTQVDQIVSANLAQFPSGSFFLFFIFLNLFFRGLGCFGFVACTSSTSRLCTHPPPIVNKNGLCVRVHADDSSLPTHPVTLRVHAFI